MREYRVTIRLTDAEHAQLLRQMEKSGFLSMSKYFRVRCLDGKSAIASGGELVDTDIASQINILSSEIAKIGANYNKVVKDFQKVLPKVRKDGQPVVNTKAVTYFLQQLNTRTLEVKALMDHIIGLYENSKSSSND